MTERWDGSTWKAVKTPAIPGQLSAISIGPSGRGWAVGFTVGPTSSTQTLITHWDGTAWH